MKPFIENEDSGLYSILLHGVVDPLVVSNDHGVAPHRAVILQISLCYSVARITTPERQIHLCAV